jgi:hypothetical protein
MSVDLHEYDPGFADAAPEWLARFVHDEVRPLLLRHQQTSLDAWTRWLARHEERKKGLAAWEARQQEFLRLLAALPEDDPQRGQEPPAEGLVWMVGRAVLEEGRTTLVGGWGPLELSHYSGQPVEYPLPPPLNRDLSLDEQWVALLAVHDLARDPREQLGSADSVPYVVLRDLAKKLTEPDLPRLQAMHRVVEAATSRLEPDTTPVTNSAIDLSALKDVSEQFEARRTASRQSWEQRQAAQYERERVARQLLDPITSMSQNAGMCDLERRPFDPTPYTTPLVDAFFEVCAWMAKGAMGPELEALDETAMVGFYAKDRDAELARIGYLIAMQALREGMKNGKSQHLEQQLRETVLTVGGRHVWYMMYPIVRGLVLEEVKVFRTNDKKDEVSSPRREGETTTHPPVATYDPCKSLPGNWKELEMHAIACENAATSGSALCPVSLYPARGTPLGRLVTYLQVELGGYDVKKVRDLRRRYCKLAQRDWIDTEHVTVEELASVLASGDNDPALARERELAQLMSPRAADASLTAGFQRERHDPLIQRLQNILEERLTGKPRLSILQSLHDNGCDLLIEWPQLAKYGVQLKSNGDVESADFAGKTLAQIQDSRQHGLRRLYLVLAADITSISNSQKVRGLVSRISSMNDPYVVVMPPEQAWGLLRPPTTP